MLYDKTLTLHYFIKRFDRTKPNVKYHVEDFAQLSGKNRNTKYDSSMEQVATLVEKYCTFPAIEKVKLFRLTLFNFLTGSFLSKEAKEAYTNLLEKRSILLRLV